MVVAERMIRIITAKAWAMKIDTEASIQWCGEAVNTAVVTVQVASDGLKDT